MSRTLSGYSAETGAHCIYAMWYFSLILPRKGRSGFAGREKAFRVGSASALVLFIAACGMVYRSTHHLLEMNRLVEHSQEVLVKMEGLQSALDEAVSSTRNYVLSGEASNLDRFATATKAIWR